jgi:hypothetical protein
MFLYHGTSFEKVPRILSQGLLPRGFENGNWSIPKSKDFESRKDAVYLSDAYAPYYGNLCSKGALVEIDIDSLEQDNLYPDEDFLANSLNLFSEIGETVQERIKYFKENLESYQYLLKDSLQEMGNCCYIGKIPSSAISHITTWCKDDVKILHRLSYDYVYDKGGVTIFKDQDQRQLYRLLTRCFAKRESQLDELLSLLEKEFQVNNIANYEFSKYLRKLDQNGYFDNYKSWKDALIQEMKKINIITPPPLEKNHTSR